jgi:hypothetical protein
MYTYLLFQINGRWSGFRQGIITMARSLIISPESTYGLWRADSDEFNSDTIKGAASNLLDQDTYHFGKTATVSTTLGCCIH